MTTTTFTLSGLTCGSCVKLCTMKFRKIAGVQDVRIDLATGRGSVTSSAPVSISQLAAALAGTHYTVSR